MVVVVVVVVVLLLLLLLLSSSPSSSSSSLFELMASRVKSFGCVFRECKVLAKVPFAVFSVCKMQKSKRKSF